MEAKDAEIAGVKLRYLIFPWGNSAKVFHDVLRQRKDEWEELDYEKVTANLHHCHQKSERLVFVQFLAVNANS